MHSGQRKVALNSFSLTRVYFPLDSEKSEGQSSHSSNVSSGGTVSASYNPHRLHFSLVKFIRGCKNRGGLFSVLIHKKGLNNKLLTELVVNVLIVNYF